MIKVVGLTDLKDNTVFVATNTEPFINNSYYLIENSYDGKEVPCEILDTMVLPYADSELMPKGVSAGSIKKAGLNDVTLLYLAKVKILCPLYQPLIPGSEVTPARYSDIKDIIINADPKDSFVLGVIEGTEPLHETLPDELSNIAPLWKNGMAIEQNGVPLLLDYHKFREYPNIGIFGGAGSGKSFALKTICEEIMKLGIPSIVFDPHNELIFEGVMNGLNKQSTFDFTSRYTVFNIGSDIGIKFTDLSVAELENLFNYVGGLTEPQRNALEVLYEKGDETEYLKTKITALKEAMEYMDKENNNRFNKNKDNIQLTDPLQHELYYKCKNKVSGISTLQALSWKYSSLLATNIFVKDVNKVKETLLLGKTAIIRGNMSKLQMIASYLINKMYLTRRAYVEKDTLALINDNDIDGEFFPPFFTIIDEAHNFAPSEGYSATKQLLRTIAQEARKFGVFLGLCTQRPNILDQTIVAQLSSKFIFRLSNQEDIKVAKTEGNLTDSQTIRLPELKSGHCFATSPILNKTYPVLFRTTFTNAGSAKDPFVEMNKMFNKGLKKDVISDVILNHIPFDTSKLAIISTSIAKELNEPVSIPFIKDKLREMCDKGIIKATKKGLIVTYTQ